MAFHVERGTIIGFGHHDVRELLRTVVLQLWPPRSQLLLHVAANGGYRRGGGHDASRGESGFDRAEAEVVIGITLADVDRGQRLPAGPDRLGESATIRQCESAVDE